MKIAVVSPFEERVPPVKYGGTELVVYNLVNQLVSLGHDVTLLAPGTSESPAKLIAVFPEPLRTMPRLEDPKLRDSYKSIGVSKIVTALYEQSFDIIHNHLGWRLLGFQKIFNCPIVTTLHGPLGVPYQQRVYGDEYQKANYVSISDNQRLPMPQMNYIATVYNGLDLTKFRFFPQPKDYFAFLGRMSPEKGPVQAIEIAKKAKIKLVMAAKVDVVDQEYFDQQVKPLIDGEQIQFIGEVDHAGKLELLGNAKALIAPIQWEEPFGLFFVEAMACGTPVIAMGRGSVPELIVDNKTGFICQTVDEAVMKLPYVDRLNRQLCFDHVETHFSATTMANGYVAAYEKLIGQSQSQGGL